MKMKKHVFGFALMMGAILLTGCVSDSKNNEPYVVTVTEGLVVVNNGSAYNGIDGSLTFVDFQNNIAQQNVYKTANGASLGGTPNDVVVYGEKVYVVGSDENTVFVLNRKTFKEISKISTTAILGEENGVTPRHITYYGGKVYVSTYGTNNGYVAEIDTTSFNMTRSFEVGSAPEGLRIGLSNDGNTATLYVANSDYGRCEKPSISIINLNSGAITEFKHEMIRNPQEILVSGDVYYVLDWGYYDENWMQKEAGVYAVSGGSVTKVVPDATGMAGAGRSLITFNYPYGSTAPTYSVYNVTYGSLTTLTLKGDSDHPINSPAAIAIDPNTYTVMIASRPMDPDTGYPSYAMPGFVNLYDSNGQFMGSFNVGIEPYKIEFTYGTTTLN